jgi:diguanylate cyclase (GGDEF)-like protein/PAS domain S-box-containing protein
MAKVLVVDDDAVNRKLMSVLLTREGHVMFEAGDGADGLELARRERPELVISDILMPSMDGYEFVRQLRADPELHDTRVIFHTAHYHEREANSLALSCSVDSVLVKPCSATQMLETVEHVLAGTPAPKASNGAAAATFDREHLRLVTNKLSQNVHELQATNAKLAALTELNLQLASERGRFALLEKVCAGARGLIGAKYAVLAAKDESSGGSIFSTTSGIDFGTQPASAPAFSGGPLGRVFAEGASWRALAATGLATDAGLPASYPPARAFLAVPIKSLTHTYGWMCLAEKVGADEFDAEDERILAIIAAQVGRIYENSSLYVDMQLQASRLRVEIDHRERTTKELRESEERFRRLAESVHDVFFIIASDFSKTFYISPAYERIWGRSSEAVYANPLAWTEAVHEDDRKWIRREIEEIISSGSSVAELQFRVLRPDGAVRWVLARTFPIVDDDGAVRRVVGVATDITERKQAEFKIQHLNRVLAVLSGINALIVRVRDRNELCAEACRLAVAHGQFEFAAIGVHDPAGSQLLPVASAGGTSDLLDLFRSPREPLAGDETPVASAVETLKPVICNDLNVGQSLGGYRKRLLQLGYGAMAALPLIVEGKAVGCLLLVTEEVDFFDAAEMELLVELAGDIAFALDHIQKADRLNYLAYYDALTGLANSSLFHERVSQHLSRAMRSGHKVALIIADPERFAMINDSVGRHGGDQLLRQVAERLTTIVGDANEVARISSNQFAAVIPEVNDDNDVGRTVLEWWEKWLGAPFEVDGNSISLSAKAGIALFPNDGSDTDTLVRAAEAALKNAKATGEGRRFYSQRLGEETAERIALEKKLRRALENEEFVLYYHQKVDVETRRLAGVEALVRWQSPELGLVPPGKFISLMEESGQIIELGAWALRQASLDRSRWLERRLGAPRVAVNVSMVQLRRENFVRTVSNILRLHGSEAGVDLEITESILMENPESNIEKLREVRDLGVAIAIDDFGTGYSSLGYLAKLPVETLKIDRTFISAMLDDPAAMTLVSTMISLAHALKLEVVAEGVESEEQAKILRLLRCDQMQGFLISKPLSFDDMGHYMGKSRK